MEKTKLYTLGDVSEMTSLTTRTLRNHLKDGTLKGIKLGGQWRFTEEDLNNYLYGINTASKEVTQEKSEISPIDEFLSDTSFTGKRVCSIVEMKLDENSAEAKEYLLRDLLNWYDNRLYMRYTYEYNNGIARYVIYANPELTISAIDLLS